MTKFMTGALPSPPDPRDYLLATAAAQSLPSEWMAPLLPDVVDQGIIGNCVAQAGCYVTGATNSNQRFDPNWIYGRRREDEYQGYGMRIRDALKTLQKEGNVPYSGKEALEVPDVIQYVNQNLSKLLKQAEPYKIEAYVRLYSLDEIRAALIQGMKIIIRVGFSDFSVSPDGYFIGGGTRVGGHAMTIWGYKDKYFYVQNSWGKSWGKGGRCWMHEDYIFRDQSHEVWGITDVPNDNIIKPEVGEVRIKCEAANIPAGKQVVMYAEPSTKSEKVGNMKRDDVGVILRKEGEWCEVSIAQTAAKAVTGWVKAKYLKEKQK